MNRTTRLIVLPLLCAALWMPRPAAPQVRMQPAADSDAGRYYVHGFDNEWSLDVAADRNDAVDRFLLTVDVDTDVDGGARAVVIETTITIDGAPYREATEQIVDRMLAVAQGDSPVFDDEQTAASTSTATSKTTQPPAGLPTSMWRRLERYAEANATSLDRDEARWMVARVTGGPALMMLRGGMLPVRLAQSPLWHWLDTDGDGALAAEEIRHARQRLALLDADRGGTLDRSEWPQPSGDTTALPAAQLVRVGTTNAMNEADAPFDLDGPFDVDAPLDPDSFSSDNPARSGPVDDEALARSDWPEPQLRLIVRLGKTDQPRIEVVPIEATGDAEQPSADSTGASALSRGRVSTSDVGRGDVGETALVEIAGLELYVTVAAGGGAEQETARASHQVSVGTTAVGGFVGDAIDTNRDRRLTPRELREVEKRLAGYDRNGDGRIDAAELPRRYRLLFSLGPTAHALLASDIPLPRPASQSPLEPPAPAWFATMDLNRDGDLSVSEFLGTADVFKTIDSDGDGLISAAEAARLDAERRDEPE